MSGKKIILVTGANTGIGFYTVQKLLESDPSYHILLGGRSTARVNEAIKKLERTTDFGSSTLEGIIIDVCLDDSIKTVARSIDEKHGRLDVLVNNAGVELDSQLKRLGISPREMFAQSWDTNVTGPHLLTDALVPLLLKSNDPRILFFTSGTASLAVSEDDSFILNKVPNPGWPKTLFRELPAYKSSKLAINMIMRDWSRVLRADGVKVWTVNPGFFATHLGNDPELMKRLGAREPEGSGSIVVEIIEGKHDDKVGKVISSVGKDGIQDW